MPKRRLYPPHWLLLGILAEVALYLWLPAAYFIPAPWKYLGALVAVAGLVFGASGFRLFSRAKTGIRPFSEATSLVASGPYRYSRNPMYVGMTSLLVGLAIVLGAATPFLVPIAFVAVISERFIQHEEAQLERTFGPPYLDLKKRVRRWL